MDIVTLCTMFKLAVVAFIAVPAVSSMVNNWKSHPTHNDIA